MATTSRPATATEYHYEDFEWEQLRDEAVQELQQQEHEQAEDAHAPCACAQQSAVRDSTADSWDKFHSLHQRQPFFKERRYLVKEFPELLAAADRKVSILEVGCGTGSSVLPVMRANSSATVYACDCSKFALGKAVDLVQASIPQLRRCQFVPFSCDVCTHKLPAWLCCTSCSTSRTSQSARISAKIVNKAAFCNLSEEDKKVPTGLFDPLFFTIEKPFCCIGGMDIVMLIFTLSAIPPDSMKHVVQECLRVLAPGGFLLFRDYGLYDMTMRRFPSSRRVGENLYQRGDGTLSYFFTPEVLRELFKGEGFLENEISYCCVEVKNSKKQLPMKRVWVHAKFTKPLNTSVVSEL